MGTSSFGGLGVISDPGVSKIRSNKEVGMEIVNF